MLLPVTISESRPKAILRAAGLLVVLWACGGVATSGDGGSLVVGLGGGAYCLFSLFANLWIVWKPGGVVLTARGLESHRPWGSASLPWKDVAGASIGKVRLASEIIMAPFNGFRWVELQRRDGGAPITIVGSELAPQALKDLIVAGRAEWLAHERAIFDLPVVSVPTPLLPAKAGTQAEFGPGQADAG